MSNLEHYRSCHEYREILRILQKSSTLQENLLWQTHDFGKNIINVHHFEIDFVAREVVVMFDTGKYRVNPDLPLYVKLDYRGTVFKVTNFRVALNSLCFSFPDQVKTQELRSARRHIFNPQLEKHVAMRPALSSMKEISGELHFRSLDISPNGLGLVVSEHNRSFLKNNRILWITKLQDQTLPNAILAEVVYINNEVDQKYINRRQKDLKVGLKLSESFPAEYYSRFIQ
jgi:hypothetical protein